MSHFHETIAAVIEGVLNSIDLMFHFAIWFMKSTQMKSWITSSNFVKNPSFYHCGQHPSLLSNSFSSSDFEVSSILFFFRRSASVILLINWSIHLFRWKFIEMRLIETCDWWGYFFLIWSKILDQFPQVDCRWNISKLETF